MASTSSTPSAPNSGTTADPAFVPAGTTSPFTSQLIDWIWPFSSATGPDLQREQMREQAGGDKFRNESFTDARTEMVAQRSQFEAHREKLVSSEFAASRARFRSGRTQPYRGPALGSLQDPDVARAVLLGASAASGVPLVSAQPVLAYLLPAFGN